MGDVKILVVEDEAVTGMDIQKSLTEMGYSVVAVAASGELALRHARELHPDLILMDIMLSGKMTGIEAADIIRKKCRIPVVYLTAYSDDTFLARAKITEPFGYILKPFREMELKTTIEMALYKFAMEHALRISEETNRVLLNATEDYLFLIDPRGRFLAVNRAFAGLAGRNAAGMVGTEITSLVTQGLLSPRMAAWTMNPAVTAPVHYQEEFHNRWYETSVYPVAIPEGDTVLYAVSIRDVTKDKASAEQSRQNEEFFRSLLEESSDIIAILNRDGSVRYESPSLSRSLGYPQDQVAGRRFSSFVTEADAGHLEQILGEVAANPGTVRRVKLTVRDNAGIPRAMDGIISNLYGNPVIDGIILNGWIRNT